MGFLRITILIGTGLTCLGAKFSYSCALETLIPTSTSTYVLDTCMHVCSDLAHLHTVQEQTPAPAVTTAWMDALLGKMVRLQAGIDRLAQQPAMVLPADDLVYLLAMINRMEVAYELVTCDSEYQELYHTLLHTIKKNIASLLTLAYTRQSTI